MHHRRGDRVGTEGQAADGVEVEVRGHVEQHRTDERGRLTVERHAAKVDVVVSLLAGGQDDAAVHDGLVLDLGQQQVSIGHGGEPTAAECGATRLRSPDTALNRP